MACCCTHTVYAAQQLLAAICIAPSSCWCRHLLAQTFAMPVYLRILCDCGGVGTFFLLHVNQESSPSQYQQLQCWLLCVNRARGRLR
jgi:hypothetical protein